MPDVTTFGEIELGGMRHIHVQASPVLGLQLRRVVELERTRRGCERCLCVNAVELRNLVPQTGDDELARSLVLGGVSFIAPPEVVRTGVEQPASVGRVARKPGIGEQHAVADVLVTLESSRIAIDAAEPYADLQLVRPRLEQTTCIERGTDRCLGGRLCDSRRQHAFRCRQSHGLRARGGRHHEQRANGEMKQQLTAHVSLPPYRMKNCPDGWFEPCTFEWQFTHDRPNIRLLLFVVISSLSYSVEGCRVATWQR